MLVTDLTEHSLRQLVDAAQSPCVSIYVPLSANAAHPDEDRIRLKNQLDQAEKALRARDYDKSFIEDLLRPGHAILDTSPPAGRNAAGLALLRCPNTFEFLELPASPPETCAVSDTFFVKPLLELININRAYRVLALSQNEVRLYTGNRYSFHRVEVPNLPPNLAEALREDDDTDNETLQFHTGAAATTGERPAVFHGNAGDKEDSKARILRFCQLVDHAVTDYFTNQDVPLVIAAADPMPGIYQQASHYRNVHPDTIAGDPRQRSEADLHARAWQTVAPDATRQHREALDQLGEALAKERATTDLHSALTAAEQGRVATLFVNNNDSLHASADRAADDAKAAPDGATEERVNRTLVETIRHGGHAITIEPAQMPAETPVAALYRY